MRSEKLIGSVLVLLVVVALGLMGMYTIEQGYRGVVLRFGKVIDVADSGMHFKIPFVDTVHKMSVRTVKLTNKIAVYSKDIQGAEVVISMNYHLSPDKVQDIYTVNGLNYDEKIIVPQMSAKPKDVFGKYNAVNIVQTREALTSEIQKELEKKFENTGIVIESVQIENIDFSDAYENSVEERMKAEVEVQKVQQNLAREKINADMMRAKAQGEADARLAQAQAQAKSIELVGKAEAEAIRAKSEAMRDNPNYVQMLQAEKWDGKLPSTMLPNNALPILK